MTYKPRNSLVLVRIVEQENRKVGEIIVSSSQDEFAEADVIAVGPGSISATGGISENHDLKVGQRVHVLWRRRIQSQRGMGIQTLGNELQFLKDGKAKYFLFEQANIFGILAEPDDERLTDLPEATATAVPSGIVIAGTTKKGAA